MASYQSNFGKVKTSVIKKLRLDPDLDTDKVAEWINQVYVDIAMETRYLQTSGTAMMTQDSGSYSMPNGVLHIMELVLTDESQQVYPPLVQKSLDQVLRYRQFNTAVGPPRIYALAGQNQLEVWPAARSTDVLTFWYSYLPDELVADGDVSDLPEPFGSKLLEYGALAQGAEYMKDPLLGEFQGMFQSWMAKFQRFQNRRQGNQPQGFEVQGVTSPFIPPDRSSDWAWSGYGWY